MKIMGLIITLFLTFGYVSAQSLKPENPYPLNSGINKGISDSLIGTQYWYFYAKPGNSKLTIRFKKDTTLYGAKSNNILTITITDDKKTWHSTKTVSSNKNSSEVTFTANKVQNKMKIIVSVAPPNQNLIRMGGDYEIEATGDVEFDKVDTSINPILRTYDSKVNSYGATRFLAEGKVEASDGSVGTWKVFDAENHIYTVVIGEFRFSVQYIPGYGLVKPGEPETILFQELKR